MYIYVIYLLNLGATCLGFGLCIILISLCLAKFSLTKIWFNQGSIDFLSLTKMYPTFCLCKVNQFSFWFNQGIMIFFN
jgi:hypothetical protein